jgi:hypothetical protein
MPWKDPAGYVVEWADGRQVRQHRLVAEKMLGRSLLPSEHVHHRNGQKEDNRPENLEVVDNSSHVHLHWQEGCYQQQVLRQTKPDSTCVRCGWFGHLRALGMCRKCYHQDYYERHPERWKSV